MTKTALLPSATRPRESQRFTPVVLNLFTEGSQIQACDFVREPH